MASSNLSEASLPKPETEPAGPPVTPESESLIQQSDETPPEKETPSEQVLEASIEEENGDEEEVGECGFCLFMKAGGCRDTFTDWEKCVDEGEKNKSDIVEKCFQATAALKKCMEAHSDYYAPLLEAEKAAEEEAAKQLQQQENDRSNSGGDDSGKKDEENDRSNSGGHDLGKKEEDGSENKEAS